MHPKFVKFILLLLLGASIASLHAQSSVNTAGGKVSGIGGSVSYSVGQLFYTTHAGTGGSVIQGIQHAFEISVISSIKEANNISLTVSVHPNPATEYLTLEIKNPDFNGLRFQLFDSAGKLLLSEKILANQTRICMDNLVPSTYYLNVIQQNKVVKLMKIIKL
jgi:hypothetical protein